jgi:cyclopropane fatty-acyl-phospholipid synthase-like methyltransferase
MDIISVLFWVVGLIFFVAVISAVVGVPYLSVHKKQRIKMMELAGLKPGQKIVDLGSGIGNLLFLASEQGVSAVGYELNPFLVLVNRCLILKKNLKDRVSVRMKSLYQADLKDVDVVFAFLLPEPMKKLESKLFNELKPGALILSYAFPIPNREPVKKEQGIFVYRVGERG